MTRVDVIVSTYNHPELLATCLSFLAESTFSDYSLIVVDDHSDRPVTDIVRKSHPRATVIRSRSNVGLIRCLNAAIDIGSSEFVVLLNDDTEVEPRWLETLVKAADSHIEAGSVASKLRLAGDRNRLHSAGDTYSVRGIPGNRGVWLEDFGQYDQSVDVFAACGGAALYRRTALDQIRLVNDRVLDPFFFMYCEDVDLAWRLQMNGWRCVFAPDAVVYHHLSATSGGQLASYYVARNTLLIVAGSVPSAFKRQYGPRIIASQLGRFFYALWRFRERAARATLKGLCAGALLYFVQRKRRRTIEKDEQGFGRVKSLLVR